MIIYSATKEQFIFDVQKNKIETEIYKMFQEKIGRTSLAEIRSWQNSMMYMANVLMMSQSPDDSQVAIEYQVPNTSKRVDFIITGLDNEKLESVVIVELKQWDKAEITNKDAIIKSYVGGAVRELSHPSYQAWTYAKMIQEYNETVRNDNIQLYPCAYLHNFHNAGFDNPILNQIYQEHLNRAPAFLRDDAERLTQFIDQYIKYGDNKDILYRIDNGRIRPSKSLGESIASMLDGNDEFFMIDDQKVVYEELKRLATTITANNKNVIIVEGGPGTGKSVIAINLLVELINEYQLNTQYVTRNAAPRGVYSALLKGYRKKSFIDNLFRGSGSYVHTESNYFDVLIVDEAHRLTEKSGMFQNLGENQMLELINASKLSIFFIDENQSVTWKDFGSKDEIRKHAEKLGAEVYEMALSSQFRCNGSDGYLAWLDNTLEIKETANVLLDTDDFDFQIVDDPNELREKIFELNKINNKARLLAGYCWNWDKDKRNDKLHHDINIPKYNFSMSWNLGSDGSEYLIKPESVNEAGCIHTSQGLEVDYVGVIIGKDLIYRNGKVITVPEERAKTDQSLKGFIKALKEDPETALKRADEIIKNTYRTLLTRGMKGCYVYIDDLGLKQYIKENIN